MSEKIFITGATGFIGSYVLDELLRTTRAEFFLLTRAKTESAAVKKLWKTQQLHRDTAEFFSALPRVRFVSGDLTADDLGMSQADRRLIVDEASSVLHIAASLNRKSAKACLNNNLRGTLSVVELARAMADNGTLRRFSHVSTVAVAGKRQDEEVFEDDAIDWNRSDYDPYARTKKFCEHMIRRLLPDVQKTFFRPSIVMGDARSQGATTQFDMVRAFCTLADMPILPFSGRVRLDIVNADWVGHAIAKLHMKSNPKHEIYHLSAGKNAKTAEQIAQAMLGHGPQLSQGHVAQDSQKPSVQSRFAQYAQGRFAHGSPRFMPFLQKPFVGAVDQLASWRAKNSLTLIGSLLHVFMPYITFNTVFNNDRACAELDKQPVSFLEYCADLYRYANLVNFEFPAKELQVAKASQPAAANDRGSSIDRDSARQQSDARPFSVRELGT